MIVIIMFSIQYQYSIVIINERNSLGICAGEVHLFRNHAATEEQQLDELQSMDEKQWEDATLCDDMIHDMFKNFVLKLGLDSWDEEALPPREAVEQMKNDSENFRVLGPITHSRMGLPPGLWNRCWYIRS